MATLTQTGQTVPEKVMEEQKTAKAVLGGSLAEGIVGGATIVLALIGLSGYSPQLMLSIATIALGAAFLFEGGAISMRFSKLLEETSRDRLDEAELGIGLTSEFLGGIAGVVLGILALLGLHPMILIPVAVIVFGSTLMFSTGVTVRLDALELEGAEATRLRRIAHEAVKAAAGAEFLLGLSAAVLGIIALAGVFPSTVSLVAVLIVGLTGFFTGAAITARMTSLFRR